jgi:hypothetical protein
MNENDLARRIVAQLDQRLAQLPTPTVEALQAARRTALARLRPAGAPLADSRTGGLPGGWGLGRWLPARLVLPVAIIIAGLTGLIYWQMSSQHEDELDAGLLAGELPIHAYIDPGFDTWLEHTSHSPQQP